MTLRQEFEKSIITENKAEFIFETSNQKYIEWLERRIEAFRQCNVIQPFIMENFGKFIDDIRNEIKWINIHFDEEPYGESMSITIPPSTKRYIVDTTKIGKIEYDTPMYSELLEMTIEQLRMFN